MTRAMTRERLRANHAKINQIPCPRCGAPAHAACKHPGGLRTPVPHQARRHAAAQAGLYVPGGAP